MGQSSGIAVLDKAVLVLDATAGGPCSLADLVEATGLPRATAYRLAVALESQRMLGRDAQGRWRLGQRIPELAAHAPHGMLAAAPAVLAQLATETGESAQLYRRDGDERVCLAAVERATGLRDTVPVGSRLPMTAGSAAQALIAWDENGESSGLLRQARFDAADLSHVRAQGWAASVGEREPGVASVSVPVRSSDNRVVAAVSVSGPISRLGTEPGPVHAAALVRAADALRGLTL